MRRVITILPLLLLGACTFQAKVPMVDGSSLANIGVSEPGKYSAAVPSGGWNMTTEVVGRSCSAHTYKADLNGSWEGAMKTALTTALEKVEFVGTLPPASQLASSGYTAAVDVMQSNASSKVQLAAEGFFTAGATSQTTLDGVLVIEFADGSRQQQAVTGQGMAHAETADCGDATTAIGKSGAVAIRDFVQKAVLMTKLLIAQHLYAQNTQTAGK
jgi:hypothetical protein